MLKIGAGAAHYWCVLDGYRYIYGSIYAKCRIHTTVLILDMGDIYYPVSVCAAFDHFMQN